MLTVSEVLTILEKEGLTSSRQVVLRWIRQGNLPAVQESRKTGYKLPKQISLTLSPRKKKQMQAPKPTNRQPTIIKQATRQP